MIERLIGKEVLVRGDRSGVFVGVLKELEGTRVILNDCRRIWYWDGAASISQIAMEGVSKPNLCKFPIKVKEIAIFDVIEIIQTTPEAIASLDNVPIWSAKE